MPTSILSPAKINLTLEILGRRPDGYHDLSTIFHTISFSDELFFDLNAQDFTFTCDDPAVPLGEENLVVKAVRGIETIIGHPVKGHIELRKRIPMGAGLGGGSSNAAAVLRELGHKFAIKEETLHPLAATLGADVPFFLNGKTAWGQGKGESLVPLPSLPAFPVVIVKPPFPISTALAYSKVTRYGKGEKTKKVVELIRSGKFDEIFEHLTNDFEEALFPLFPDLPKIKETFVANGARAALLSGSGSAMFAVARDESHAEELAQKVKMFGSTWITST